MAPADQLRELNHISQKISVLKDYPPPFAYKYFQVSDKKSPSAARTPIGTASRTSYVEPKATQLGTPLAPEGGIPGRKWAAAHRRRRPRPRPKPEPATEPPPEPEPPQVTVVTCAPCQKIAENQIKDVKERLKTLNDNAAKAGDAVKKNQQTIANLQKRVANLQAELARAAGTGGSSFTIPERDRPLRRTDQGNGTVKVTTKDAAGNVIEEHVREASARKADIDRQITDTNAEIAKAQAEGKRLETAAAKRRRSSSTTWRRSSSSWSRSSKTASRSCLCRTTSAPSRRRSTCCSCRTSRSRRAARSDDLQCVRRQYQRCFPDDDASRFASAMRRA